MALPKWLKENCKVWQGDQIYFAKEARNENGLTISKRQIRGALAMYAMTSRYFNYYNLTKKFYVNYICMFLLRGLI